MGKQAQCTARWRGRETQGEAHLEGDSLRFRSDKLDVTILLRDLGQLLVKDGVLMINSISYNALPSTKIQIQARSQAEYIGLFAQIVHVKPWTEAVFDSENVLNVAVAVGIQFEQKQVFGCCHADLGFGERDRCGPGDDLFIKRRICQQNIHMKACEFTCRV